MFPAGAGVILAASVIVMGAMCVSRRRGGDPQKLLTDQVENTVFPAGAGVIPLDPTVTFTDLCVSRRRGGDPTLTDLI